MEQLVMNVHERVVSAPLGEVRSWLDEAWSGTERDIFPRDKLPSWRESGPSPRFGHGNLAFRVRHVEDSRWEADVLSRRFRGEHRFELEPVPHGTRVRHVLEGTLHGALRVEWPMLVRPLHDWAVEAMFDRLELAVAEGQPPLVTERVMEGHARAAYALLDSMAGGALSQTPRSAPHNWGARREEMRAAAGCDGLVKAPYERLFRAVTVKASPALVFRWLCQLRAAPYSYDWIDNFGRQSPRSLTAQLDELEVGQRFMRIFTLHGFEPGRSITLVLSDPAARRAFGELAVTYSVDDRGGETRLLAKLVVRYPRSFYGRVMRRFLPWGDLVMMRKQLVTLERLAERDEREAHT